MSIVAINISLKIYRKKIAKCNKSLIPITKAQGLSLQIQYDVYSIYHLILVDAQN